MAGYCDFYRSQAYVFLAQAYTTLGEKGKAKEYVSLFEQTSFGQTLNGRSAISETWRLLGDYDKMLATYDEIDRVIGDDTLGAFTGNRATLTGTVTGVDAGKPLWFFLHHIDIDFTGQTGVLLSDENSIEKKYDHAVEGILNGNFTVDAEHSTISLGRDLELPAQQAIVKFTLVDEDGNAINAQSLTISDASSEGSELVTSYDYHTMTASYGDLTVTPASPTNMLYVALGRIGSFDCRRQHGTAVPPL